MTTDGAPADALAPAPTADEADDDGTLHCYRHPGRETWVRCGRCDRPICPKCAMQGPVGFRCRDCGKPAYDPLTSVKTVPAILGFGVALAGGLITAMIASRIGFFSILLSWFAGSVIVQGVNRVAGFKHGPTITAIILGGIIGGALIGFALDYALLVQEIAAMAAAAGEAGYDYPFTSMLVDSGIWALVSVGACCVGAWQRLR